MVLPPPPTKLMYLHTNMCTPNCNSIVIENWKKKEKKIRHAKYIQRSGLTDCESSKGLYGG